MNGGVGVGKSYYGNASRCLQAKCYGLHSGVATLFVRGQKNGLKKLGGTKMRPKRLGGVVYFDQRLGAAHPERWSKSSFSAIIEPV